MTQPLVPIIFQEHLQLCDVGVRPASISFDTVTLESHKFICVRDVLEDLHGVTIIDMDDVANPKQRSINAEITVMHPMYKVMALKGKCAIRIYNLETKTKLKGHLMDEEVKFLRWISNNVLAIITDYAVYHWSMEGDSTPVKAFNTDPVLHGCKIINYQTDATQNWLLLTILPDIPNQVISSMQLHCVDEKCSHTFEGYAASFATFHITSNQVPSTIICFAVRTKHAIRLNITELGQPPMDNKPFDRRATDIYFPPEAHRDFPVAIQVSAKYDVAYLITKFGFIHLYDIESGICIYMQRISPEAIFVTAPHIVNGGIIGINRSGQVLSVTVDENNIISYVAKILHNPELAKRMAVRYNLVEAEKRRIIKEKRSVCRAVKSQNLGNVVDK